MRKSTANVSFTANNCASIIETKWHRIVAWNCLEINRGSKAYVIGHMRANRNTDSNGNQQTAYEVLASEVKVI